MPMTKGESLLGKLPGGHSTNWAKLNKNAALTWDSREGSAALLRKTGKIKVSDVLRAMGKRYDRRHKRPPPGTRLQIYSKPQIPSEVFLYSGSPPSRAAIPEARGRL